MDDWNDSNLDELEEENPHVQAGRKGGEKTSRSRGQEYYMEIGRKGGRKRQKSKKFRA